MSLKGFHIVFIFLSILLTAGFTAWIFVNQTALPVGVGSGILSVLLTVYLVFFIKKSRNIIT